MPDRESSAGGAVEAALRALGRRDLSAADLERRLARAGYGVDERADALARLERTALLDDRRYAESRARALATRGAGDAFVRYELERSGIAFHLVDEAIGALEPELERARAVVARRGRSASTARYLRGKGFADETVAALVAGDGREELG